MNETSTTAETWPEAPFQFDVGGPLNTVELSTFLDRENAKNYELGNPEYYLPKWMEILYGRGKFAGFNWAAAIFGWLWCLYRKQYKLAITVALLEGLVIPIIVGLSLGFIFGEAAIRPYFETFGTYCGILFVRPWLGFAANPRYLRRAADVIAIARQSAGNELELIQKHGGTSTIALVTGLIINTGLVLYDAYLSIDTSI